jgi:hypothetical protein
MNDVASLAWRVVAVASAAGYWIDRLFARLLPQEFGRDYASTRRSGSMSLVALMLLLTARNLILAIPYTTTDPIQIEALQQRDGIYDNSEFPEIRAARQALEVFGGLSILLAIGWLAGDPPFRRRTAAPPRPANALPANAASPNPAAQLATPVAVGPNTLLKTRLSGKIDVAGRLRRLRDEPEMLQVHDESRTGTSLLFYAYKAGKPRPLGLEIRASDITDLEIGDAYGQAVARPGLRFRAPPGWVTLGFAEPRERDAIVAALRRS